jgi:hypothetical protein
MNGLLATHTRTTWREATPFLSYVYGIIDYKINSIEYKTRQILDRFRSHDAEPSHQTDIDLPIPSIPEFQIDKYVNEQLFTHFEELSRSIYLLEQMKLSLNEENAVSIIELLDDDNYMNIADKHIHEMLNINQTSNI